LSETYYARATRLALTDWQYEFACNCCSARAGLREFQEAARWFELAEAARVKSTGSQVDYSHFAIGLNIAISAGNRHRAEAHLQALLALPAASSSRFRAIAMACQVRIAQMDETYRSAPSEVTELSSLMRTAPQFECADSIAMALCEAHRRNGDVEAYGATAREYLQRRRDPGLTPVELVVAAAAT